LTLKWIEESKLSLVTGLGRITHEPARVLGVNAGELKPGTGADLCIFDPARYWKVDAKALKSQGKNTPYTGVELKGKVSYTLVEGQLVYEAA
jgi:dihydroorotase